MKCKWIVGLMLLALPATASAGCDGPCTDGVKVHTVPAVAVKSYVEIHEQWNDYKFVGDSNGAKCLEDMVLTFTKLEPTTHYNYSTSSCINCGVSTSTMMESTGYLQVKAADLRGMATKLSAIADSIDAAKKQLETK